MEAFIGDFHAAWQRFGIAPIPTGFSPFEPSFDPSFDVVGWAGAALPDFAAWDRELAVLVGSHLTVGSRTGEEGSVGNPPPHDPAVERIVSVELTGAGGEVRTTARDSAGDHYWLYRMALVDRDWRIARITQTLSSASEPVLDPADADRLVAATGTVITGPAVDAEGARGIASIFSQAVEVADLGPISAAGTLLVVDVSALERDERVHPLALRVPPGSYLVQVARDSDGTNVGLRVIFGEGEPESWYPADRVAASNEITNFYNTVTVADFAALASSTKESVEVAYQDFMEGVWAAPLERGTLSLLTADSVTIHCGDQDLAAYWGATIDGTPLVLVVDFQVG